MKQRRDDHEGEAFVPEEVVIVIVGMVAAFVIFAIFRKLVFGY